MGSLTSRPKIPKAKMPKIKAQTVQTITPATVTAVAAPAAATVPAQTQASSNEGASSEAAQTASRTATGLLDRSRGVFGTVLTGFRGVLADKAQSTQKQRKTLLGE